MEWRPIHPGERYDKLIGGPDKHIAIMAVDLEDPPSVIFVEVGSTKEREMSFERLYEYYKRVK